jgi:hypothetical protein
MKHLPSVLRFFFCGRVVTDYVDSILRENASRAVGREPPLTYREAKERWNEAIEKRSSFTHRAGWGQDSNNNNSQGQGSGQPGGRGRGARGRGGRGASTGAATGGGAGGGAARAGAQLRGRGAKFNGNNVCYHFNNSTGCRRTAKGAGCDNGNGGEYAHVCNFETSPGNYCLAAHPRTGNH